MAIAKEEYAARRERLGVLLEERGIDALFVPPSSDLEYLTGIQRDLPSFDGRFGVRVEDVLEVTTAGGRFL